MAVLTQTRCCKAKSSEMDEHFTSPPWGELTGGILGRDIKKKKKNPTTLLNVEEPHQATAAVITEDEGIDWRLRSLDGDGGEGGGVEGLKGVEKKEDK